MLMLISYYCFGTAILSNQKGILLIKIEEDYKIKFSIMGIRYKPIRLTKIPFITGIVAFPLLLKNLTIFSFHPFHLSAAFACLAISWCTSQGNRKHSKYSKRCF